ncbi:hypothetical protein CLOM_g13174 [Closterium sp. NIES-68]|nr:hypothetical protein CLOM_g13174 [Closterium sp. NIES-68]GJP77499.1 hypothetical protein CLOP_g7881 [Closterium sp. NIES-67]
MASRKSILSLVLLLLVVDSVFASLAITEGARNAAKSDPDGPHDDAERNERRLLDTATKLGLSAPPLSSGPSMAVVNMSFYRWESVAPPSFFDWRTTSAITPIQTQFVCASCWAIAAVDSIAMMWAIANNATAASLSPQQVCDCATKQCCQGGWPEWAFSYVLFNGGVTTNSNYPYFAYDSDTCLLDTSMPSMAQITGWELVPAFNRMALMKAVSKQPVVAFLSASTPDFAKYSSRDTLNIYNGLCTTEVNHAVVVVGYNYTGPDLTGSYWILKNSWYATWGDRGYMYLAMIPDVRGKCGILSTPAMYPVYYPIGPQPARFSSDKRGKWNINKVDDLSSSLFSSTLSTDTTSSFTTSINSISTAGNDTTCPGIINPCGGGSCLMSFGIPRCNCSMLANMVELAGTPTSKCVPRNPCTNSPVNPCAGGTCTDVGDGTYTCACTAGYAIGAAVDGSPTCMPSAGLAKSYVTLPGDNCTTVATAFSLSTTTLTALNTFINCSVTEYLPPGIALTVSAVTNSTTSYCTTTYTVRPSDTCTSVANAFFGGSLTALLSNNTGLSCKRLFKSQQICLQMVTALNTSSSATQCGQSAAVSTGDTCASLAVKFLTTTSEIVSLNPGLNCNSNLNVGSYVCVAPKTSATTINCTGWYRVMQGDTCPSIWNAANLTMSMFLAINPGIQCQAPYLAIGQQVCIDSPILTTMQRAPNVSYTIHTVRTDETLPLISSVYAPRCTSTSISPTSIAAANFIANASAPLVAGTKLIIPCVGRIGIVDCGCAASLPVCGLDFVTYPSYCDAVCNYAVPLFTYDVCPSNCAAACFNRMGLAPLANLSCTQAICPYPTWPFPSASDCTIMLGNSTGPCCNYRMTACQNECNDAAAANGGTSTQKTEIYNSCYSQCMCCSASACGGSSCKAPSSCWSASPRKCSYSVATGYMWNCGYFPAGNPLP